MLENQFIQFKTSVLALAALDRPTMLIMDGSVSQYSTQIFIPGWVTSIKCIKRNGTNNYDVLSTLSFEEQDDYRIISVSQLVAYLYDSIAIGEQVFLRISDDNRSYFSNPLIRVPVDGFTYIKYRCNEDALGFPFSDDDNSLGVFLPLRLHSPQNVQDDKTYVKANGEVVTLYAKYYKEWEGETEYLSEDTHDKIVAALSCDEVYINGRRMTKSDKYQVDWDKYDLDCDGVTKLAKATFKVREHITQRNSNY